MYSTCRKKGVKVLSKPHILPLFPNLLNKFNEILALVSDPLCNAPKLCFLHDLFFHGDLYNYGQSQVSVNEALKFKVNSLKIVADRFTQSFRYRAIIKIVSEYDQELPQSQTADNPVAPRGIAAQPSRDTRKIN